MWYNVTVIKSFSVLVCKQIKDANTGQKTLPQMDEEIMASLRGRYSGCHWRG